MPQLPEELIQALMQMTGGRREDIEKQIQKVLGESVSRVGRSGKVSGSGTSGRKSGYTRIRYPHYLKRETVLKYTVRITLKGIKPAIWRKVEVSSNISLRHLGDLTLDLMGWDGGHLNQFVRGDDCFLPHYQREASGEADFDWDCNNLNQEDYCLSDLLEVKGRSITFEYDFGDGWEHEIKLSSVDEYKRGEAREIVYKGGKRACPPEDCGGIWGYEELLDSIARRKAGEALSDEETDKLRWYFGTVDHDPEVLDTEHCLNMVEKYNE